MFIYSNAVIQKGIHKGKTGEGNLFMDMGNKVWAITREVVKQGSMVEDYKWQWEGQSRHIL